MLDPIFSWWEWRQARKQARLKHREEYRLWREQLPARQTITLIFREAHRSNIFAFASVFLMGVIGIILTQHGVNCRTVNGSPWCDPYWPAPAIITVPFQIAMAAVLAVYVRAVWRVFAHRLPQKVLEDRDRARRWPEIQAEEQRKAAEAEGRRLTEQSNANWARLTRIQADQEARYQQEESAWQQIMQQRTAARLRLEADVKRFYAQVRTDLRVVPGGDPAEALNFLRRQYESRQPLDPIMGLLRETQDGEVIPILGRAEWLPAAPPMPPRPIKPVSLLPSLT